MFNRRALSFDEVGDLYLARPPYATRALARIRALARRSAGAVGVDIGARIGDLSHDVDPEGKLLDWIKVDPSMASLRAGQQRDAATPNVCAKAQDLPLRMREDQGNVTMALVIAGTALHWMRCTGEDDLPVHALKQISEALPLGGWFVAAYNDNLESSVNAALDRVFDRAPNGPTFAERYQHWRDVAALIDIFPFRSTRRYKTTVSMDGDRFGNWCRSLSDYQAAEDDYRAVLEERIAAEGSRLFAGRARKIRYRTVLFIGRPSPLRQGVG